LSKAFVAVEVSRVSRGYSGSILAAAYWSSSHLCSRRQSI
jgi:hypothetical protein